MNFDHPQIPRLLKMLEQLLALGEQALGRHLPPPPPPPELFAQHRAFRWIPAAAGGTLEAIMHPDLPRHTDLLGIDRQLKLLRDNTAQFVEGLPANNVLLWGDRGTGKSTAVRGLLEAFAGKGLKLVELQKEDLFSLPAITRILHGQPWRFILFCDDLSFDESEVDYRQLKALLEGGLESRPENVLVYATSNRRHLMPERLIENTGEDEIHPEERVAEKLSLSDRFGLACGFYSADQEQYLAIVRYLARQSALPVGEAELEEKALRWSQNRAARSGRVARQFIDDLTGRLALAARITGGKDSISRKKTGPPQKGNDPTPI